MLSSVKKVFFSDYVFHIHENVYEPAEDSFLLAENLIVKKREVVLDMGTGCGILGIIAAGEAAKVVAVDINPYAVRCAKENAKLNGAVDKMFFLQGNLFTPIKMQEQFDLILFNAPYLPSKPSEAKSWLDCAWAGGATGRRVIDRFIYEAPKYLKKSGRILMLQSTSSDVDETLRRFDEEGLKIGVVTKRSLPFFEAIVLVEAER